MERYETAALPHLAYVVRRAMAAARCADPPRGRLFPGELFRSRQRLFALRDHLRALAHPAPITPRELQVAELYAAGVPLGQLEWAIGPDVKRDHVTKMTRALTAKLGCGSPEALAHTLARLA